MRVPTRETEVVHLREEEGPLEQEVEAEALEVGEAKAREAGLRGEVARRRPPAPMTTAMTRVMAVKSTIPSTTER